MVLPLLFALGGQLLAGMSGAGWLGAGLGAFAGNAFGQGVENGFEDINWGAAALSGLGAGVGSAAGGASMDAAKTAAAATAAPTSVANLGFDAATQQVIPGQALPSGIAAAAQAAPAAGPLDFASNLAKPETYGWENIAKAGGDMIDGYTKTGLAGVGGSTAQMMANVPKMFKDNSSANAKAEQEKMKKMWDEAAYKRQMHEADNNAFRYSNTAAAPGRGATPADVQAWMRSAGINRGYAEGGATPVGLGLANGVAEIQGQNQQEAASNQTRKMFDIAAMLVMGKLDAADQQKAFQILADAMGEQQAMQYLQQVKESIGKSGGPKVVAGKPSEQDNVMAQDAHTGEPIKLASGEGILPTGMVEAAGGGLDGVKNIVGAAAKGLPQLQDHASRFMSEAHS